jgi:hypothetical protein
VEALMELHQAFLAVDKLFESGFRLPEGTPIRVQLGERIYKHKCDGFGNGGPDDCRRSGCGYTDRREPGTAFYYDNPQNYSTRCFVVTDEEYSLIVRAKTDEPTIEVACS